MEKELANGLEMTGTSSWVRRHGRNNSRDISLAVRKMGSNSTVRSPLQSPGAEKGRVLTDTGR